MPDATVPAGEVLTFLVTQEHLHRAALRTDQRDRTGNHLTPAAERLAAWQVYHQHTSAFRARIERLANVVLPKDPSGP